MQRGSRRRGTVIGEVLTYLLWLVVPAVITGLAMVMPARAAFAPQRSTPAAAPARSEPAQHAEGSPPAQPAQPPQPVATRSVPMGTAPVSAAPAVPLASATPAVAGVQVGLDVTLARAGGGHPAAPVAGIVVAAAGLALRLLGTRLHVRPARGAEAS